MPNYNSLVAPTAQNTPGASVFQPFGPNGVNYNWFDAQVPIGANDLWYQATLDPMDRLNQLSRPKSTASRGGVLAGGGISPTINPSTGLFTDPSTGQPFSGTDAQGNTYQAGKPTGAAVPYSPGQTINPNDPNQRYRAVDITKQPDIASAESDLMTTFKKGAQDSMKGFDDWLKTFQTSLSGAFKKSQAADDPSQTIATLQGNQARYNAALDASQKSYADLNANTAAKEQGIVQEARDLIPMYDQAAQDAANQSLGVLQRNVSRYKMGSGTPMSLGSAEEQQLLKGAADILVPMEQAKIGQRYNVLNQYAMPATLDVANREQARIGQFDPQIAQQEFQSGNVTANTIQGLLTATAQMSRQDAIAFMQAIGVPAQVQQQILTGQIGQLGGLSQLENQSRYSGLQDVLGVNPTPSQYSSLATGPYPNMGRYAPTGLTGGTANSLTPANAPISTGTPGAAAPAAYPTMANNGWVYGNANRYNMPGGPPPLTDEQLLALSGLGTGAALNM